MPEFNESAVYAAFGLEQPETDPAGERDPEPADPGAQEQEAGTVPAQREKPPAEDQDPVPAEDPAESGAEPEGTEPPAEGSEKPAQQTKEQPPQGGRGIRNGAEPQTAAQRAQNAARRRREEQQAAIEAAVRQAVEAERARSKGELDAFFAGSKLVNTITGKPITNLEGVRAWKADYDAAQAAKALKAGKLTPEAIQAVVEQTPALQAVKKLQEQQAAQAEQRRQEEERQRQAAARARVEAEIEEIHKMDPTISSIQDLMAMPTAKTFYDLVKKGNSFLDAFRMANFDRLTAARAEAARQQAMNNARGKSHLTGTGPAAGTGAATVPAEEMEMFRLFNPGASDKDITAWYNKHFKP